MKRNFSNVRFRFNNSNRAWKEEEYNFVEKVLFGPLKWYFLDYRVVLGYKKNLAFAKVNLHLR